jgi:hypothetical protein
MGWPSIILQAVVDHESMNTDIEILIVSPQDLAMMLQFSEDLKFIGIQID